MVSRCVEGPLPSLTFYLLMTIFCFVGLLIKKLLFLRRFLTLMVLLQVNLSTINYQKSKILLSSNTIQHRKSIISAFLGVTESIGSSKYLGFLSIIGKWKKSMFYFIKDRLWNLINNWTNKHLSKAGEEILVNFVAQSIPIYCMSVFLLPSTL